MGLGIHKDSSMTVYTVPLMEGDDKKWRDNTWICEHLRHLASKIEESRMNIISIGVQTIHTNSPLPELVIKGYEHYVEAFVVGRKKPLRAIDFNAMPDRTKWNVVPKVKDVNWVCNRCNHSHPEIPDGETPKMAGMDTLECPWCDNILTHRTNGGQNNPFNWTFVNK